jgi:SulP family sulfate permease
MTHAAFLAAVVVAGAGLVSRIPLAVLAAVLIVTAVRMVDASNARAILRSTRSDALVFVVTATVTVVFDLILAVEIGVGFAIVLALRALAASSGAEREEILEHPEIDPAAGAHLVAEHIAVYRLDGGLFFGAAQRFLDELTAVSAVQVVVLRLGSLRVLDATGAQALAEVIASLERRGITVLLCGVQPHHRRALDASGAFDTLAHERHVFTALGDAIGHARRHVREGDEGADGALAPLSST